MKEVVARVIMESDLHLRGLKVGDLVVVKDRLTYQEQAWIRTITGQEYPAQYFEIMED